MIDQIQLLRNLGQFDSVSPTAGSTLNRFTVIYAENGRGKTTLAAIWRSLSNNDNDLVLDRKRLGSSNPPHLVFRSGGQSFTFQNGQWSANLPEIAIFDDHFVTENVCSGIEIEADHRQKLHELILGSRGVALSSTLQTKIAMVETCIREQRDKEAAIPASIRGDFSINEFCALEQRPNVDHEIQEKIRAIRTAESADEVRRFPVFENINLPLFDIPELNQILHRSLEDVEVTATALVKKHIIDIGSGAENWISAGTKKILAPSTPVAHETCPFCAQSLEGSALVSAYKAYFSKEYSDLKNATIAHGKSISQIHSDDAFVDFEREVRAAEKCADFWRNFTTIPTIKLEIEPLVSSWKTAKNQVLEVFRQKFLSPLERASLSEAVINSINDYHHKREQFGHAYAGFMSRNNQLEAVKTRGASGSLPTLKTELAKLNAIKSRHSVVVAQHCASYFHSKEAKSRAENERDIARRALDQYRSTIFSDYETFINQYLTRFGAGFRLSSMASTNNRGGSSCSYSVLINNSPVPLAAATGPSFKTTLSAGDRNTLALAFFFASLDRDPNLAQKIVVIDDPMTSLDEHRSSRTIHEVRELVNKVTQVIVLSHSKPFLCELWLESDRTARTSLQIIRRGQTSVVENWDVQRDCVNNNDRNHELIDLYISEGGTDRTRPTAVALRPTLEAYIRVGYSRFFPPNSLLGHFINRCGQAHVSGNPILSASDVTELQSLTNYANKFHHDSNLAYESETINDQELVDYCHRVISFVRRN